MEPILMRHPQHGATHVYDLADMERLKGYGWSPVDETPKPQVQQVQAPVPKRRGRPPKAK